MLDSQRIVVDLLLHLALVLFEVCESLLEQLVLLLLRSDGIIVRVARQLQLRHDMRHVVLVHGFENVAHLFDFTPVALGHLPVLFELVMGVLELILAAKRERDQRLAVIGLGWES